MHLMKRKKSIYVLALISSLLVSCGGGGSTSTIHSNPSTDPEPDPSGLLIPIADDNELLASVRAGFDSVTARNRAQALSAPMASEQDSSIDSFTTTYTLEATVDEHDAVKYDGNYLFIAPSRGMGCCFVIDDIAFAPEADTAEPADIIPIQPQEQHAIRIVATNPENASATEVSSIELSDSYTVEGLYAHGNQLAAISASGWWGVFGDEFGRVSSWQGQTTAFNVYDMSDAAAPKPQMQIEFQGGFVSSRKKGDNIFLVARHTPHIDGFDYYPEGAALEQNEILLNELTVTDILPTISVDGVESPLIEAKDCLITDQEHKLSTQQSGYPTLTLIIAVNLADQTVANTACYLEPTDGIYVSENAIYLAQVDYNDSKSRTLVHSYALSEDLTYLGSGAAEGSLFLSGNNDFRINEHKGYLRLMTTEYSQNAEDWVDHKLTVLKLNNQKLELEAVATLPNNERSQPIGKPNEDLYGVRFLGDKLYLVTFERIDPLYVVDLSEPSDPFIAGELMVPGFSDFLHPINDQLLLGLGEDENRLVKLELFNVGDMNAPFSLGTVVLGKEDDTIDLDSLNWSHSEARYNRHAFTYQAISDSQARFLVPATLSFYDEAMGYRDEDRLYLFEVNNQDIAASASINQVGYIAAERDQWFAGRHRGVIHNDSVYFINGTSVWSTLWSNPTEQNGPQ